MSTTQKIKRGISTINIGEVQVAIEELGMVANRLFDAGLDTEAAGIMDTKIPRLERLIEAQRFAESEAADLALCAL